jgi:hypothetical protein
MNNPTMKRERFIPLTDGALDLKRGGLALGRVKAKFIRSIGTVGVLAGLSEPLKELMYWSVVLVVEVPAGVFVGTGVVKDLSLH